MYASGQAIHEAVQRLLVSNPRRFEREKYVEQNDIEGSSFTSKKGGLTDASV
jgi:hypothetical protein